MVERRGPWSVCGAFRQLHNTTRLFVSSRRPRFSFSTVALGATEGYPEAARKTNPNGSSNPILSKTKLRMFQDEDPGCRIQEHIDPKHFPVGLIAYGYTCNLELTSTETSVKQVYMYHRGVNFFFLMPRGPT